MIARRLAISALLCVTLAACAEAPKRSGVVTPQRMSCTGNRPAALTLDSPTDARLSFEGKTHQLKRMGTASGIKYGNGDISIWHKGVDAMIERDDRVVATCTYIPKSGL